MPLLAVIPEGRVLDPVETKPTRCERTYEDIRAQVLDGLLPSQLAFVEDKDTRLLGLCAGFGCVAGETLINGRPIRELTEAPIRVQTLAGPAWASPAYRKGVAPLFRVRTEGGREVVVTKAHRFLTPYGWQELGRLRPGSLIAACDTTSAEMRPEIATDCSAAGPEDSRSCDGLPSPGEVFGQELAQRFFAPSTSPSRGPVRSRFGLWRPGSLFRAEPRGFSAHPAAGETPSWFLRGLQNGGTSHAPLPPRLGSHQELPPADRVDVRVRSDGSSEAVDLLYGSRLPDACSERRRHASGTAANSRGRSPAGLAAAGAASGSPMVLDALPEQPAVTYPSECTRFTEYRWDTIKTIAFDRVDEFFDLHVPVWNHYEAHGLLHHNSGKTHALCAKAVMQALDNPNTVAAVFEPTHIMIRDVWCRSFDDYLEQLQLDFEYRVTPQPEYRLHVPGGICTLLCRSTETWGRIRGQNLSFCLADEIDTSPEEIAQKATEMMLARLRGGQRPQLAVASTPEGYRWLYRTFVENGDQPDRRLIKARTRDNPHLPPGFVESLQANYPPQLIASYLDGEFTNLANSTVYYPYDRDLHWCDTELQPDDRIFCAVDFNIDACFVELIVRRGDEFHVVQEHIAKDTPSLVKLLRETYESYAEAGNIVVVPDASSNHRTTSNASQSDLALLRKAGFPCKAQNVNPEISDRVNCVNVLLLANRLRIHSRCRYLIKALEQQAYDNNGKPQKGRGGKDDISGPIDALGYGIHYLAPLRRYASGQSTFYTY